VGAVPLLLHALNYHRVEERSVAKLIGVLARQIWRKLGETQKPFLNKELRGFTRRNMNEAARNH
jgi:hypothetical protein